jgi:hypothetical protein
MITNLSGNMISSFSWFSFASLSTAGLPFISSLDVVDCRGRTIALRSTVESEVNVMVVGANKTVIATTGKFRISKCQHPSPSTISLDVD